MDWIVLSVRPILLSRPALYIKVLSLWSLSPIIDGVVDNMIVPKDVEDSYVEMIYDVGIAKGSRISSGNTIEEVYAFLEDYMK